MEIASAPIAGGTGDRGHVFTFSNVRRHPPPEAGCVVGRCVSGSMPCALASQAAGLYVSSRGVERARERYPPEANPKPLRPCRDRRAVGLVPLHVGCRGMALRHATRAVMSLHRCRITCRAVFGPNGAAGCSHAVQRGSPTGEPSATRGRPRIESILPRRGRGGVRQRGCSALHVPKTAVQWHGCVVPPDVSCKPRRAGDRL